MRFFNLYRLASYTLILFSLGHTFGALLHPKSFGPNADAVVAAMNGVLFNCTRPGCSWEQFYLGFGWFCTVFMLFSAVVAWHIGGLEPPERQRFATIAWALCASYLAAAVISWVYLFALPAMFSVAVAALLMVATIRGPARATI